MRSLLLRLIIFLTLCTGAAVIPTFACSWFAIPTPPLEYVVSRTPNIFVGTLLEKSYRRTGNEVETEQIRSILFRIDRSLKGQKSGLYRIEYRVPIDADRCGEDPPNPEVGEKWTMFDGYSERNGGRVNVRTSGSASEKFSADKSETIERILRAVQQPSSTFYGQVQEHGGTTVDPSRYSVELRSKDGKRLLQSVRVEKEHFAFRDLAPGEYVVRLRSSIPWAVFALGSKSPETSPLDKGYKWDYPLTILKNEPEFKIFVLLVPLSET